MNGMNERKNSQLTGPLTEASQ